MTFEAKAPARRDSEKNKNFMKSVQYEGRVGKKVEGGYKPVGLHHPCGEVDVAFSLST